MIESLSITIRKPQIQKKKTFLYEDTLHSEIYFLQLWLNFVKFCKNLFIDAYIMLKIIKYTELHDKNTVFNFSTKITLLHC